MRYSDVGLWSRFFVQPEQGIIKISESEAAQGYKRCERVTA